MKKFDIYGGLIWLFMAIFVISMGVKFGLGTIGYPGPGFFPFLVGLILLFLAVGIIILAQKEKNRNSNFSEWPFFGRNVFLSFAFLFAYSFSLEFLGYIIASFLLMFYLFKVPGGQKWWYSMFVTVVMLGLSYYLFGVLLQAQFPKGVFNLG